MATRTRQYDQLSTGYTTANGTTVPSYVRNYPFSFGSYSLHSAKNVSATITDQEPTAFTRREENSVEHVKNEAARFGGDGYFTCHDPLNIPVDVYMPFSMSGSVMYVPPPNPAVPNWGSLVDQLAASLDYRSKDASMLLISLKELSSTVRMIRNPFSLLTTDWRKKAKNLSARALAKDSANVWLEHLYGWKSFYSDLTSFSKACGKSTVDMLSNIEGHNDLQRFSAQQADTGTHPYAFGKDIGDYYWNYMKNVVTDWGPSTMWVANCRIHNVNWISTSRVYARYAGPATSVSAKTRKLLGNFDLSSWQSLRDTLWEAIPYSFVIDWFIDTRGLWAAFNKARISSLCGGHIGYSTKYVVRYMAEYYTGYNWAYNGRDPITDNVLPSNCVGRRDIKTGKGYLPATEPGTYTQYIRYAGFPTSIDSFVSQLANRGLTYSQLASGLSLLAQRFL